MTRSNEQYFVEQINERTNSETREALLQERDESCREEPVGDFFGFLVFWFSIDLVGKERGAVGSSRGVSRTVARVSIGTPSTHNVELTMKSLK